MENPKVIEWGRNGKALQVEFDGRRYSAVQFVELLKELSAVVGAEILSDSELQNKLEESYEAGYERGRDDEGDIAAEEQADKAGEPVRCAHCGKVLPQEAVERLSDRVAPSIDLKDIAKVIFAISDYNEACKNNKQA